MHRTRVKICGIVRPADALAAANLGADALGFILHARSRRLVEPAMVKSLRDALPPMVSVVGVFVDASAPYVMSCVRSIPLDYVQLHGNESADYIRALGNTPVIRATRATSPADREARDAWPANVLSLIHI